MLTKLFKVQNSLLKSLRTCIFNESLQSRVKHKCRSKGSDRQFNNFIICSSQTASRTVNDTARIWKEAVSANFIVSRRCFLIITTLIIRAIRDDALRNVGKYLPEYRFKHPEIHYTNLENLKSHFQFHVHNNPSVFCPEPYQLVVLVKYSHNYLGHTKF